MINKLFSLYRKFVARQLHVESYYLDRVWNRLKKAPLEEYDVYVMTPANYELIKHNHGAEISKGEMDKIMSERVKYLDNNTDVGLHVHFWVHNFMPTEKKRFLLDEAINWGEENGICFSELVPGWWRFDDDLKSLCSEFDLKLVEREPCIHDYELVE